MNFTGTDESTDASSVGVGHRFRSSSMVGRAAPVGEGDAADAALGRAEAWLTEGGGLPQPLNISTAANATMGQRTMTRTYGRPEPIRIFLRQAELGPSIT
jgi:hypothetical protein